MKKDYLKLKKSLLIISTIINIPFITSCTSEKEVINNENQNKVQTNNIDEIGQKAEVIVETTQPIVTEFVLETQNPILENNDEQIIDYFNNSNNEIDCLLNKIEETNVKEEIFAKFIKLTDFIFCNGDINGIKFNDLKEETKEKLKEIQSNIDMKIDSKIPGYKDSLKDKYYQITTYIENNATINNIKDTYNETKEQVKDKVDETVKHENTVDEFWQSVEDDYEDVKDMAGEAKEKVKEKYNNWSEKYRK